jgi:hypothetical protein
LRQARRQRIATVVLLATAIHIKRRLRKGTDKFEREWNYDASYMRDMIDASPRTAWLVSRVTDLLAAAAAALVGGSGLPHRRPHTCRSSRAPPVFTP